MLVGQQAQVGLGQCQGHPEKTNLADNRELAHFFRREQAQHEQRERHLRGKRDEAGQGDGATGFLAMCRCFQMGSAFKSWFQANERTFGTP